MQYYSVIAKQAMAIKVDIIQSKSKKAKKQQRQKWHRKLLPGFPVKILSFYFLHNSANETVEYS